MIRAIFRGSSCTVPTAATSKLEGVAGLPWHRRGSRGDSRRYSALETARSNGVAAVEGRRRVSESCGRDSSKPAAAATFGAIGSKLANARAGHDAIEKQPFMSEGLLRTIYLATLVWPISIEKLCRDSRRYPTTGWRC